MPLTPELQILILNAVIAGVAYLGIYPSLNQKTINRILTIDCVLSALALFAAGALFWGTGTRFSLLIFQTNWVIFTILTLFAMELPLFLRFARKYDIKLFDDDMADR